MRVTTASAIALTLSLAIAFLAHRRNETYRLRFFLKLQTLDIPSSHTRQLTYATQASSGLSDTTPSSEDSSWSRRPDTTAVVLNWSRLDNVLLISTLLCSPQLHDTITRVLIWNNNPEPLTFETFSHTGCNPQNLEIYNSPHNIYFQARFIACAGVETPYCFIQDDDYLVRPELIKSMHSFIHKHPSTPSVHLLPAHEHLLSRLRAVASYDKKISTSFAWLGFGTFVRQHAVCEFLQLLKQLNLSEVEMQMADNYFTILANRQAEIWFDHGIELGGGQPFTVGFEGDERNDKHMTRALEYLIEFTKADHFDKIAPYVSISPEYHSIVNRSPCLKGHCLIESNISLLPGYKHSVISQAKEIVPLVRDAHRTLKEDVIATYLDNPLSNAVDDDPTTSFCSPVGAKKGDWIALRTLDNTSCAAPTEIEFSFLVSPKTVGLLHLSRLSTHFGGDWIEVPSELHCYETDIEGLDRDLDKSIFLTECAFTVPRHSTNSFQTTTIQSLRVELSEDTGHPWSINEVWLRCRRT